MWKALKCQEFHYEINHICSGLTILRLCWPAVYYKLGHLNPVQQSYGKHFHGNFISFDSVYIETLGKYCCRTILGNSKIFNIFKAKVDLWIPPQLKQICGFHYSQSGFVESTIEKVDLWIPPQQKWICRFHHREPRRNKV